MQLLLVQAIALVSVGSFGVASILLCGLFVYDVVWVFGTEVMVSVAKVGTEEDKNYHYVDTVGSLKP